MMQSRRIDPLLRRAQEHEDSIARELAERQNTLAQHESRLEELRHAKEEGIEFFFLHGPVEILTSEDGNVRGMKVQKMVLGEPDEKGRRQPIPQDEFLELECDTVIYALGTQANPIITKSTPGLNLNKWGYIEADPTSGKTLKKGVWAGGDIVTGSATVILAMGAGRNAARLPGGCFHTTANSTADASEISGQISMRLSGNACVRRCCKSSSLRSGIIRARLMGHQSFNKSSQH